MPRYLWRRKGGAAGTRRMTQTVSEGGLREGCSCWGVKFSPSSEARRCMGLCHCQRAVRSGDRSSTSCKSNGALSTSAAPTRPACQLLPQLPLSSSSTMLIQNSMRLVRGALMVRLPAQLPCPALCPMAYLYPEERWVVCLEVDCPEILLHQGPGINPPPSLRPNCQ